MLLSIECYQKQREMSDYQELITIQFFQVSMTNPTVAQWTSTMVFWLSVMASKKAKITGLSRTPGVQNGEMKVIFRYFVMMQRIFKGGFTSEGILTLFRLPTKSAKSCLWAENSNFPLFPLNNLPYFLIKFPPLNSFRTFMYCDL